MNNKEMIELIDKCKEDLKAVALHAMTGRLDFGSACKLESVRTALDKMESQLIKSEESNKEWDSHYTNF